MHTTTAPTYEHDLIAADEAEVELQQACWNNGLWLADLNSDQRTRLPIFREAVRLGLFTDEVARP